MLDRQQIAEGFAALRAAANGTPMADRLTRWLIDGGDEDPAWLLALASAEANFRPCPNCGFQRRADDLVKEVEDAVLRSAARRATFRPVTP